MEIIQIILASLLSFIILFIMTKLTGNKQLSQMNTLDYIIGITVGSIAAEMATNLEEPLRPGIAIVIYGMLAILVSVLTNKSIRIREFVSGKPLILMENDKIYKNHLTKARLDINEFLTIARLDGYFDISQIETAVFEHNGNVSFLPKTQYRPATPDDMKMSVQKEYRFVNVIIDGKIMQNELRSMKKDEGWLRNKLKEEGYRSESEIFLATLDCKDNLHFYKLQN